jgi:phenylalanyl-tRNA synthetase beta chain
VEEVERLIFLLTGNVHPAGFGTESRQVDYLDLRGEVEAFLRKFCLDKYRFIYYDSDNSLTDPSVGIEIHHTYAGYFGKVKKEIAQAFGVEGNAFVCEVKLGAMEEGSAQEKKYIPLPRFPSSSRDLAFAVDGALPQVKVDEVIREAGVPLLRSVQLFDSYVGEQTGKGKKSLAYALEFLSEERTLEDEEVEQVMNRIVEAVRLRCGGVLRQ